MSGAQRVLMAAQMFETAQRIVLSSLPVGMDGASRRRALCRRVYGSAVAHKAFGQTLPQSRCAGADRGIG